MADHFFIAGAQRCATTWLYGMLKQHPQITLIEPVRPEPKYFLRSGGNLPEYLATYFERADTTWFGEKSTSYIESPEAARRIAEAIPRATVIFMLRDPVERAISNYRFSVANGLESLPFEDALDAEATRSGTDAVPGVSVSPFSYAGRGHYARFLDYWYECFPADQIRLLVTEHTVGSPTAIRSLLTSLGLPDNVPMEGAGESINSSAGEGVPVPRSVRGRLSKVFQESNRVLARRYGVDIGAWQ